MPPDTRDESPDDVDIDVASSEDSNTTAAAPILVDTGLEHIPSEETSELDLSADTASIELVSESELSRPRPGRVAEPLADDDDIDVDLDVDIGDDEYDMLDVTEIAMLDSDEQETMVHQVPRPGRAGTEMGPPPVPKPPPLPARRPPPPKPASQPARAVMPVIIDHDSPGGLSADGPGRFVGEDTLRGAGGDVPLVGRAQSVPPRIPPEAPEAHERPAELRGIEIPTVVDRLVRAAGEKTRAHLDRLVDRADRELDPDRAADLRYEVGIAAAEVGDLEKSKAAHLRVVDADPSHRANLWALRRLYRKAEQWDELAEIISTEARFARDDAERASLLVEQAQLLSDRLGRDDEAHSLFQQATVEDPGCVAAWLELERRAERSGDASLLEACLRALADRSDRPVRRLHYLLELAQLLARGGDLTAAEALAVVDEAAAIGVDHERVGRVKERVAEIAEDWQAALAGLELQVGAWLGHFGPAGPPAPQPRDTKLRPDAQAVARSTIVALRRRQARIARQQLEDPQRAWDYLQQALLLLPNEPLLLADLADLAERLGKFEELARLCAGWESQEHDPVRSLSLSLRRAEALLHSDQTEEATKLLSSLSAIAPGYLPVTALLERDAINRMDWRALAEAYAQMAESAARGGMFAPGAQDAIDRLGAAGLFTAAADLMASPAVEDFERARALFNRALEVEAGFAGAVEGCAALYERYEMLEEACHLLELQSEIDEPERRVDYLFRLNRMYQELGRFEDQVSVLERLATERDGDTMLRFRLEELLSDLGRHEERLAVIVALAEDESDPSRKAALWLEAGRACEFDLGRPEQAIEHYRAVLALLGTDDFAREALQSLYRRTRKWRELVDGLRDAATSLADGPRLARVLREAAEVCRVELNDPQTAAAILRELCDRLPGDESALYALALCLRETGDPALPEVLEQLSELREEAVPKAAALQALADYYEVAGNQHEAKEVHRRLAELVPDAPHSALALVEDSMRSGSGPQLASAVAGLRAKTTEPRVIGQLSELAGWAWLLAGDDADHAVEEFTAATEAGAGAGAHLGAALARARIEDAHAQGDELARLGTLLQGSSYSAGATLLRAATAAMVAGESRVAAERVAAAHRLAPDDAGVLIVAAEHAPSMDSQVGEAAAEQLVERGEMLTTRAALAESESSRDSWELSAASALERGGRLRDAGELVVGVLKSQSDDLRALRSLRTLCRRSNHRDGYARACVGIAKIVGDQRTKLELFREAAAIFDGELGEAPLAVPIYRRILQVEPEAPEFTRLREILSAAQDTGGLYELLSSRIDQLEELPSKRVELAGILFERAEVRQQLGDARGASRDLERLLVLEPDNAAALLMQGTLLQRIGEAQRAAKALEHYLELEGESPKRSEVELQLSELLAEGLSDFTGAIVQLEHLLHANDDAEVRDRLIDYLIKAKRWDDAIRELNKAAAARTRSDERASDFVRVAEILRRERGDHQGARKALEAARRAEPRNVDLVRELAELVGGMDGLDARAKVLRGAARDMRAAIVDSPARGSYYERLSVICRWQGEEEGRFFALACFDALRTLDAEQRAFVTDMRAKIPPIPASFAEALSDEDWRGRVVHPAFAGAASELWVSLGPAVDAIQGDAPETFGFTRAHKVVPKELPSKYPRVHAVMAAFGVLSAEVYVSAKSFNTARSIGHDKPKLLLSEEVAKAEDPGARFLLGRAVAMAKDRSGALHDLSDADIRMYFAAASQVAGMDRLPTTVAELTDVDSEAGQESLERFVRQLHKRMRRKDRKALAVASSTMSSLGDPAVWRRGAAQTAARAGLLICGDLHWALEILDVGPGGRSIHDEPDALGLLSWAASGDHLLLRAKLGLRKEPDGSAAA